jgi:hypothetical protein
LRFAFCVSCVLRFAFCVLACHGWNDTDEKRTLNYTQELCSRLSAAKKKLGSGFFLPDPSIHGMDGPSSVVGGGALHARRSPHRQQHQQQFKHHQQQRHQQHKQ